MTKCEHPHPQTLWRKVQNESLFKYPTEPDGIEILLVLHTEMGAVPYSIADNQRGRMAQVYLAHRYLEAGVIKEATYHPPDGTPERNPFLDRWTIPHLVLSQALANYEKRFCVVEWCRKELAKRMAR